ncbi:MAG TPA: ISNCY family transposase [Candidatus Angelobacter sp.]|nr:ISNCY family transposase [Candidatus Angelobacter sp.]
MSRKELDRAGVMSRVESEDLKLGDAARLMGVSYRQAKRIRGKYREHGAVGLRHGNAGKQSHRARPDAERSEILRLVGENYGGAEGERFGPTLAAEHLEREHGRKVHAETLRRWMLKEGLWSRARKRRRMRQRRERREHFGELVQLDGSQHGWLEERGPRGCLMDMVDDATSVAEIRLEQQETTWAAARVLRNWIERHGVPLALYVDRKNVYVSSGSEQERMSGKPALTQFGRMCQKLGIRIIAAGSPQAKGRVERAHGTHQDRLVKELRLRGIDSHAEANRYIEQEYLAEHNRRLSRPARKGEDYHRAAPSAAQLRKIFRLEYEHSISNDWVVRHQGRHYQLERQRRNYAPAGSKVTVWEAEDGTLGIEYQGQALRWKQIVAPMKPEKTHRPADRTAAAPRRKTIPGAGHPWRKRMNLTTEERQSVRLWKISNALSAASSSAAP